MKRMQLTDAECALIERTRAKYAVDAAHNHAIDLCKTTIRHFFETEKHLEETTDWGSILDSKLDALKKEIIL